MPPERIRDKGEIGYTFDDIIAAGLDESFPLSMDSAKKDLEKLNLEDIRNAWRPSKKKSLMNWLFKQK